MSDERFLRLQQMVGVEGIERLRTSHVVVAGLGAVGSYATEALARAGVGNLRLVDFDVIRPSNTNRQLFALESTQGLPKVDVAKQRVLDINPSCDVEALRLFVHTDTLDQILDGPPSLVIDAIDACAPKLELICALIQRDIPAVSSMGAALRTDPTRVRTAMLTDVKGCPLARRIRKGLRKRNVPTDVLCVYSDEPVSGEFIHPPDEAGETEEEQYTRGRQRRAMGSLPTMTGIFGLAAANLALQILLGDLFPGKR